MIGKRLRALRIKNHYTVAQLCEKLGMSTSTYNNYERDDRDVSTETLQKFADFYTVPTDLLLGRLPPMMDPLAELTPDELEQSVLREYFKLPEDTRKGIITAMYAAFESYQKKQAAEEENAEEELREEIRTILVQYYPYPVSAGVGEDLLTDPEKPYDREFVRTREAEKASFAVRVSGDSMEPTFYNDDIVFVTKAQRVDIGEIGVFQMDNEGYIKEWGDMELISHNPKYPPIPATSEVVCRGKVIGKAELPPDTET